MAPTRDRTEVLRIARKCWTLCFGQPRAAGADRKERVDKGLPKRAPEASAFSEASFLRKRRHEAMLAGQSLDPNSSAAPGS